MRGEWRSQKSEGKLNHGEDVAALLRSAVEPFRYHGMISNDAILSPSSWKKYRRSTGLPGKFPVRRLVTMNVPSFSSHVKGSHVYSYFFEASVFHSRIAARPWCVCDSSFTTAFSVKHLATFPSP